MNITYSLFPKFLKGLSCDELAAILNDVGFDACNAIIRKGYWVDPDDIRGTLTKYRIRMEELGIATSIIVATFSILFAGLILALALAFGLGSKDMAKAWMERHFGKDLERDEDKDEFSHL